MAKRDVVVIGASSGGLEAVSTVLAGLPEGLAASVFVVVHTAPSAPGVLADILSRRTSLRVKSAAHGEGLEYGTAYIAGPDHHLMLTDGQVSVVRGPKENRHRPSVDVLFRSAAHTHGARVIAVVLSGNLDDGSAGLWSVKSHGGITIAQDPEDALFPDMPANAIKYSSVDHVERLDGISSLIVQLTKNGAEAMTNPHDRKEPAQEIRTSESALTDTPDARELGTPSFFTCPSCSGTLWEYTEGELVRYRCRVGHAFSIESMQAEQADALERAMWVAIRTLDERADLLRRLAEQTAGGTRHVHGHFEERRKDAEETAKVLRDVVKSFRDVDSSHE